MGVPKQVEEAAELAEEYMKGLNADKDESEAGEEVETEESEEESEESDESADDEANTEEKEQEEKNIFEEKYRVLQGKYDKEVPRLHSELKELKEKIFERIGDLSKKPETEEAPAVDAKLEAFREEYGEDLIDYLDSYFESKMKPAIEAQTKESIEPVQQKVTSLEDSQIETAKNEFAAYLDENVNGSWRDAGEDPNFIAFLEKEDPSGFNTYGELLDKFNTSWDEKRMAKVFNAYYGEKTETTHKKESSPDKDAIIAPSRKTQAHAPDDDGKIMWTPESIKQFERDDRSGKYSAEESMKLWDDLLHAPSENRIN